jgi:hypothetical protein
MTAHEPDVIAPGQLIFSHVEADQSPRRRGGHQVLFYSHGRLGSEAEVFAIEKRLIYLPRGEPPPPKCVFFTTPGGNVVVARIVALTDADACGRQGRYFAHALVFTPREFERLGNNPFAVLDNFPFWSRVEEARRAADAATGDIGPPERGILPDGADLASPHAWPQEWPAAEDFERLWLLAVQAADLVRAQRALVFSGSAEQTYGLLRELFELIPPRARLACSFDTLFLGGALARLPYWAVGLPPGEPRETNTCTFDLKQRRFTSETAVEARTALEKAMLSGRRTSPAQWKKRLAVVSRLDEWLEGHAVEGGFPAGVEEELFRLFLTHSEGTPPGLPKGFRRRLAQDLGGTLAKNNVIAGRAWTWATREESAGLFSCLRDGFPAEQLGRWALAHAHSRAASDLEAAEVHDLCALRDELKRQGLTALAAEVELVVCCRQGRWDELARRLEGADAEVFARFASWAVGGAGRQTQWVAGFYHHGMTFGPLVPAAEGADRRHLLGALLGAAAGPSLPPLAFRPVEKPRCVRLIEVIAPAISHGPKALKEVERAAQALEDHSSAAFRDEVRKQFRAGEWDRLIGVTREREGRPEALQQWWVAHALGRCSVRMRWHVRPEEAGVFFGPLVEYSPQDEATFCTLCTLLGIGVDQYSELTVPEKATPGEMGAGQDVPAGERWLGVIAALAGERPRGSQVSKQRGSPAGGSANRR